MRDFTSYKSLRRRRDAAMLGGETAKSNVVSQGIAVLASCPDGRGHECSAGGRGNAMWPPPSFVINKRNVVWISLLRCATSFQTSRQIAALGSFTSPGRRARTGALPSTRAPKTRADTSDFSSCEKALELRRRLSSPQFESSSRGRSLLTARIGRARG